MEKRGENKYSEDILMTFKKKKWTEGGHIMHITDKR